MHFCRAQGAQCRRDWLAALGTFPRARGMPMLPIASKPCISERMMRQGSVRVPAGVYTGLNSPRAPALRNVHDGSTNSVGSASVQMRQPWLPLAIGETTLLYISTPTMAVCSAFPPCGADVRAAPSAPVGPAPSPPPGEIAGTFQAGTGFWTAARVIRWDTRVPCRPLRACGANSRLPGESPV